MFFHCILCGIKFNGKKKQMNFHQEKKSINSVNEFSAK